MKYSLLHQMSLHFILELAFLFQLPPYCSEMNPIELEWLHLKRDHISGQMFDSEDNLIWGIQDALLATIVLALIRPILSFLMPSYLSCLSVLPELPKIPNGFYQQLSLPIGLGKVESSIKQIGFRVKLADASWSHRNVPKILRLRTAFLNKSFEF